MLIGLPARRHEQADVLQRRLGFLRGHRRVQEFDEVLHDLLFLAQDRSACRLGRVRGEDGLDAQLVEQLDERIGIEAVCLEADERVLESARLVLGVAAQVLAPAADAVNLLGRIHHLEVGREAANDRQREIGVEVADEFREFLAGRLVVLAPPDRPQARSLDKVEQRLAALFAYQLADHCAERAHVIAQRLFLVLELDVLAAHGPELLGDHVVSRGNSRTAAAGRRRCPSTAGSSPAGRRVSCR